MATITNAVVAAMPPKKIHAGPNVLICRVSLSATFSAGDVHRIGKLPTGIIPVDAVWYAGPALALGAAVFKLGISASQDAFFASATYSLAVQPTLIAQGLRRQGLYSLSDDANPRYDYVTFVTTAGVSIGHIGDLVITYLANENS